jgi:hypothetical protein
MQKIATVTELKNAIQVLEAEQVVKGRLLREQFHLTYESLKPVNLLKRTIVDISSTPHLVDNIVGTFIGLISGSVSNKVFVGSSGNIFRKLFGNFLQYGVTDLISKNSESIKLFAQYIFHNIRRRRESRAKYNDNQSV